MMIVSIHIPKTAGTSFSLSLVERYGRSLWRDYDPNLFQNDRIVDRKRAAMKRALEMQPSEFENVACVHGHFLGLKYGLLAELMPCAFVTWLRHPVDRLLSQYHHWVESYDARYATGFYRQCMEEKWSFERYALYEDYRNLQSQFLWGLPLASFAFVGLTEFYEDDFIRFCGQFFGEALEPHRTNVTRSRPGIESLDPGLRREIGQFHSDDMALYESALARRERAQEPPHQFGVVAARNTEANAVSP